MLKQHADVRGSSHEGPPKGNSDLDRSLVTGLL